MVIILEWQKSADREKEGAQFSSLIQQLKLVFCRCTQHINGWKTKMWIVIFNCKCENESFLFEKKRLLFVVLYIANVSVVLISIFYWPFWQPFVHLVNLLNLLESDYSMKCIQRTCLWAPTQLSVDEYNKKHLSLKSYFQVVHCLCSFGNWIAKKGTKLLSNTHSAYGVIKYDLIKWKDLNVTLTVIKVDLSRTDKSLHMW